MKMSPDGRFAEIDVLRGFAALCVAVSHYTTHCARYFGECTYYLPTRYGYYAVELFFVISGFVIYFTLERSGTWKDFVFSRATRLYPAYWVLLNLMVVVSVLVFGKELWLTGYAANLTMFQEYLGFGNLDNVYWSLTVELAFYVNMGVFFAFALLRRIEAISVAWLVLACLWSLYDKMSGIALPETFEGSWYAQFVPFFVAGIMFYLIHSRGPSASRIAIILLALAAEWWMQSWTGLIVAAVVFALFAATLAGFLRFTVSPVTLWLGTISYSLYLSHRNLGYFTLDWLHEAGVPFAVSFAPVLAGALVLATASAYLVERPAARRLRRWYRNRAR